MSNHPSILLVAGLLACGPAAAADRSIPVPPTIAMSWGYVIPGTQVNPHRTMGVGFWQRASGAKPGVGVVFVSTIEYQLPEAAPARVRSATFQFSGSPSQCVGAEPVVIDVNAYAANGKSEVADTSAGSRVAQLSAGCADKAAFSRPIDVTAIVRQLSVASGVRFVGFNIRKANNRQGPGLFNLSAGKLTIVLSDQAVPQAPMAKAPAAVPGATVAGVALPAARTPQSSAAALQLPYGFKTQERAQAAQARTPAATPPARAAASAAAPRGMAPKPSAQ
jgi:hypothetical protein